MVLGLGVRRYVLIIYMTILHILFCLVYILTYLSTGTDQQYIDDS